MQSTGARKPVRHRDNFGPLPHHEKSHINAGIYDSRIPRANLSRLGDSTATVAAMTAHIIGYARVSTNDQDLTSQRDALASLGVPAERIYVDHGLTGRNKERPGLREALAAVRSGDTLVITKLDRLARSLPDARDLIEDLTKLNAKTQHRWIHP